MHASQCHARVCCAYVPAAAHAGQAGLRQQPHGPPGVDRQAPFVCLLPFPSYTVLLLADADSRVVDHQVGHPALLVGQRRVGLQVRGEAGAVPCARHIQGEELGAAPPATPLLQRAGAGLALLEVVWVVWVGRMHGLAQARGL